MWESARARVVTYALINHDKKGGTTVVPATVEA